MLRKKGDVHVESMLFPDEEHGAFGLSWECGAVNFSFLTCETLIVLARGFPQD